MSPTDFENRVMDWAKAQSDLQALILAGSRAGNAEMADDWSDWDFQIISATPAQYRETAWLQSIAPVWCARSYVSSRGAPKLSVVFAEGIEADFVPLAAWKMRLVYAAMRRPRWRRWYPAVLRHGIAETRGFMLGIGYRLMVDRTGWAGRFRALQCDWPVPQMTAAAFGRQHAAFWQLAVWLYKKIARPEPRSAMHWLHGLVRDHVYPLLEEEARLAGRVVRSEARKAERWLDARRLEQTAIATSVDQRVLAVALLQTIDLFTEAARSVAERRGFAMPDYREVEKWLRAELARLGERGG